MRLIQRRPGGVRSLLLAPLLLGVICSADDAGQFCESHADCDQHRAGLYYCTKNLECGACEDDGERPCAAWGDSIDSSCAVCSGGGGSGKAENPTTKSSSSGSRNNKGARRGGRKGKKRTGGSSSPSTSGGDIEAPFVAVVLTQATHRCL